MYTIKPFEELKPEVRTALLEELEWIKLRPPQKASLYTPPGDLMNQLHLDSLLTKLLSNYIEGSMEFAKEPVVEELDPYAGKREVIYLPFNGTLDRGITRRR
ncbi:MAG: hypothetical protein MN733_41980 [Nitrososphaera sp.]|nr:hypothetical protein [Nitrososphaera sp.]